MFIFVISIVLLAILYFNSTKTFDYWEKRGVKYVKPVIFLGSIKENFFMQKSSTQMFASWYRNYPNEKVVGYFKFSEPGLIIRDPELVKRILITDFAYFYERGLHPDRNAIEPLLQNLFFAEGDLWKLLRQRMTPAFTSGKLRNMFPLIVDRAIQLQNRTLIAARNERTIDARDLMARYTTDFIGACGFGLDTGSLNQENSAFRKLGDNIFDFGVRNLITLFLKETFPSMCKSLKYLGDMEKPVMSLVKQIQKQRNYKPTNRNDFIDLLLEAKEKGVIEVESVENVQQDGSPERVQLELTDKLIAAQAFVFFAAGFETSSSATSYTLHQLAYHPGIQVKVQKEIDVVMDKHKNELSYYAVKEMKYLDWTFKEGMRLLTSLGYLVRKCTKKYTFPELNLTIDKGVIISIPLQAMHTDPLYFKKPLEFLPDRFSPENYSDSCKSIFLPFGIGPRACIGARLGHMQSLAGLAAILSKFTVLPAPESKQYPSVETKFDVVQSIDGGLPLRFIERQKVKK